MTYNLDPKNSGDRILAADWNDTMETIKSKVYKNGDTMTGPLSIDIDNDSTTNSAFSIDNADSPGKQDVLDFKFAGSSQARFRKENDGDLFIGTLGNHHLNLLTADVIRIRVTSTGNVGIGTTNPSEKLEVNGNIKLGLNGGLFALGAMHNLRVVIGKVNSSGSKLWGDGFSSEKTEVGRYEITFDENFADKPIVVTGTTGLNSSQRETLGCSGVTVSGFTVWIWRNSDDEWEDDPFDFIAIGPR